MELNNLFTPNSFIWLIVKLLYLLAFTLYFIFTLIVGRQIDLMARTLKDTATLPLRLLGTTVIIIALGALISALIIL